MPPLTKIPDEVWIPAPEVLRNVPLEAVSPAVKVPVVAVMPPPEIVCDCVKVFFSPIPATPVSAFTIQSLTFRPQLREPVDGRMNLKFVVVVSACAAAVRP